MAADWGSLPLLPLRCILSHLTLEDALAVTSTCRHWRQAILTYEGERYNLKLKVKDQAMALFLTRVFRKHVQKLFVYIHCNNEYLNNFMTYVLPMYMDAIKLKEVVFIGPMYTKPVPVSALAKLKKIIIESLLYKHAPFIQKFALLGCQLDPVQDENDRNVHKQVEYYSQPLFYTTEPSPADVLLSRCNVNLMQFSKLRHLLFEYELVTQEGIETLSHLKNLKLISLNVTYQRHMTLAPLDWTRINACFPKGYINVAVNIINMPIKKFKLIIDNVLVPGITLTSLKVMFCKTVHVPLISHVCFLYKTTLREVVWADMPVDGAEAERPVLEPLTARQHLFEMDAYTQVNPFVLLCWQCIYLHRLAIHGYWIWQYDLLGFARLRKDLKMEVSSLYPNQNRFRTGTDRPESILRVLRHDSPPSVDNDYIREVNNYAERGWKPMTWRKLPSALRIRSSTEQRALYISKEVMHPLGCNVAKK